MAYKKLSPVDLIASVQQRVQSTGMKCYDAIPLNAPSPFFYAEFIRSTPVNTKTMFRERYTVYIHAIAEKSPSSVGVYSMIQQLEEAMSEDIMLNVPFQLILQTSNGVQTVKVDETGEKHAILSYDFTVAYGFMCKI